MQLPTQFLDAVLPVQGWRIFNFLMPGPDGNRPVAQFDFMPYGMDELEGLLDWALRKQADAYVAIGSFGGQMRTIAQGKNAGEQKVSRAAANSMLHRCLRIDVDCGAGKPYADKQAGWAATKAFITKVGLPLPLVVDSGYGLHVYWRFDRDLDTPTWQALSTQLAAAMAHEGLQVDTTGTCDAARILRLPGTTNFKNGTQVPVRMLCDGVPTDPAAYQTLLSGYRPVIATGAPIAGALPTSLRGAASPLSAGLRPPYGLRGVLTGCPGFMAMVANKGAYASEPLWHATLALVHKADDAPAKKEAVARHLSSGHPGFDEGQFQAKWAQVQQQDYEPPTCEKYAQLGMPECATCPLRAQVKAPCVLGRAQPAPVPPPVDPSLSVPMPAGPIMAPPPIAPQVALQTTVVQGIFELTHGVGSVRILDGSLSRSLCVDQGIPCVVKLEPNPVQGQPAIRTLVRIGSYPLIAAERLLDEIGQQSMIALTFNRATDGFARVEFTHAELADARAFSKLLHAAAIHLNTTDAKLLQDKFMPEFLAQLQRLKAANAIAGRCGWSDDYAKFVLGTRLFHAGGEEHVRPATAPQEMEAYAEGGDRAAWRQAFDLMLTGGADRQAVLALGLAGPLLAFSGADGVLLNAWSPETGVGKSTLCDAILSIWGAPNKLRKAYNDTAAATFQLAAISGNLPMVIDEFTNIEGKELSNYVYTMTQGRERHRLGADSRLRTNGHRWCLPFISTSNNSVHDKLQIYRQDATAEAARVFEMRLFPLSVPPEQMGANKRILQALDHNYGFLGSELARLFVSKPEAYWRQLVTDRIAWWDAQMSETTGDRFRSIVAALIDIGAALGTALGYGFDRPSVIKAVRAQWLQQVKDFEAARTKPGDFVTDYIAEHLTRFAVFGGAAGDQLFGTLPLEFVGEIRGTPKPGSVNQLQVHSVAIPTKNLRDYVLKRNGNARAVHEWIVQQKASGGCVDHVGTFTFMQGQPRSIRIAGYRFTPEVMGHPVLTVVPGAAAPTAASGTP